MAGFNLVGQSFGRLTVVRFHGYTDDGSKLWDCVCECGNKRVLTSYRLTSGRTKSCGCLHNELLGKRVATHGGTHERLYIVWTDAKRRCEKTYDKKYSCYGGRGIKLCAEWQDYAKFREWALNNGYDETAETGQCTLDRIDVDGDYCPENCRWIPMSEQRYNCRNTIYVDWNGKKYTFGQLSKICGIPARILHSRIHVRNWAVDKAVNTPYEKRTTSSV